MKNLTYSDIREDMIENRNTHNKIVNSIENVRHTQMKSAYSLIASGRAESPSFYRDYLTTEDNMALLDEFDRGMNFCMDNCKYKLVERAIRN